MRLGFARWRLPTLAIAALGLVAGLNAGCAPTGGLELSPAGDLFDTGTGGGSTGDESAGSSSGFDPTLPGGTSPGGSETGDSGGTGDTGETGESGAADASFFVGAQSSWRYSAVEPGELWRAIDYDDLSWSEGQAPIGGGAAPDLKTVVGGGGAPVAVRLRHRFEVVGEPPQDLLIQLRRADAASVFINGAAVLATNLTASADAAETRAEGNEGRRYLRFAISGASLQTGDNVLAVELYRGSSSSDFAFDMQLEPLPEPSEVYVQLRTRTYDGEYGDRNVGAIWIESEGGEFVRTLALWADVRRQHLVRWRNNSGDDDTDAITAATRKRHVTTTLSWDQKSAEGSPVPPGNYVLRAEFTEDNSNKGEPLGPTLELPFVLGSGVREGISATSSFRDVSLIGP